GYGIRTDRVAWISCHLQMKTPKPLSLLYPDTLTTLGDHIRKVRLDRNLSQAETASLIGVTTDTVTNWELGRNQPYVAQMPAIYAFLGYIPDKVENPSLGEQLRHWRYRKGLQQKQVAKFIGIDAQTMKRVEEEGKYFAKTREKVERFLQEQASS
ncbi:MAG: helix-turn-helix transcriptional regulator, partial [Saprospiraceae bacterium]|nr:helix-turn-helix transcriptional regulator [Saprospiraceae bacterium]MCB0684233.1 helix-turn-helix transcriptional regulator [Saprospiraceae bacterium]